MPATATKPRIDYPRPRVVHDHAVLFQEAEYDDGRPYGEPHAEDDEDDA